MADIMEPLHYGRLTGDFWAVLEDSADVGESPDTMPLMGTVTFTPSHRVLRVSDEDVAKRGVVYVDKVTAQVVDGVLVDDFGAPGISLLASTEENGSVFPHNISWTAVFDLVMYTGEKLSAQPEPTQVQLIPGETKSISDFLPTTLNSGGSVRVVSVDLSTLQHVDTQVDYINYLVETLEVAVQDGIVKGDPGEVGPKGDKGDLGPYGPPGRPGAVEIYNYVKNPVPTSNEGYHATNGTISFQNNSLTLQSDDPEKPSFMTWVEAVPTFTGTNMYLVFDAESDSASDIQSTITFLNADLEPIDTDTLTHASNPDLEAPEGVESDEVGTYSHMAYTDGPASFAVFSVGLVDAGQSATFRNFFFSDAPGFFFTGGSTVDGYHFRWVGAPNNSYSVLTPIGLFSELAVITVNGEQGDVVITPETLGLGLVDNTSDIDKPVSNDTQEALDSKLDSTSLTSMIAENVRIVEDSMYLKEFSQYATQEKIDTTETFVDISYIMAPVSGTSQVRLTIPGSSTGNSDSSIPTVERSSDGNTWASWRTLTSAPPSGTSYTDIDGVFDKHSGNLKVIVRKLTTAGAVTLTLYTIDPNGNITSRDIATSTATTNPYLSPSVVESINNDGSLYLYSQRVPSGTVSRLSISSDGTLGTTQTTLTGIKANSSVKVSRFYGTFVAATADGSVAGSPGIMVSDDGVTWRSSGFTGTHTWARGATATKMSAYPGVSRGKVGIFVDYINTNYRLSRLFATSRPTLSGSIAGVTTDPNATMSEGSDIEFPGTLRSVPRVFASSNDSHLNLGVISTTADGATVERFNMSDSTSGNATIAWTAIS